jgi:RNA polymerase sigma factor (sigma-70 family)
MPGLKGIILCDDQFWIAVGLADFLADPLGPGNPSLAEAWTSLYRIHRRRLFEVATKLGLQPDEIEDIVQDLYATMLARGEQLREEGGAEDWFAWSCKVMRDKAVDEFRRRDRRSASPLDALPTEPMDRHASESEYLAEAEECRECLGALLGKLEGGDKENGEFLRRHYLEEESCQSLAEETGISVHAIECRISRTLQVLRRLNAESPPAANPRSDRPMDDRGRGP